MFGGFSPTADSYSYLHTGQSVLSWEYSPYIEIRPFLFSVIVSILYKIGGVSLLWVFQALCLIFANYLLWVSLFLMSQKRAIAFFGILLFSLNFSVVHISFSALTEPLMILGLTCLLYISMLKRVNRLSDSDFWALVLTILATLTVVKPVFSIPFFLFLLFVVIKLIRNKMTVNKKSRTVMVISLAFILFQFGIVKSHANEFTISKIGDVTLNQYLLAQSVAEKYDLSRTESIIYQEKMSSSELKSFILEDWDIILSMFYGNIMTNIQSDPVMMDYYDYEKDKEISSFMVMYNKVLLYIFYFILLASAYYFLRRKNSGIYNPVITLLVLLLFYLIVVSGLSFAQRDRFILPTTSLWIFLFLYFINWFRGKLLNNKKG
jgi:hypothetical protein